jgi:hypothetical protein
MLKESKERAVSWVVFFSSSVTLVCCTLPILLVSIGLGASMIALTSHFEFLVVLGNHKFWVFFVSGILLIASNWYINKKRACPADKALAEKCAKMHKWNQRILWFSIIIWIIGFTSAYLALPIRKFFEYLGS